MIPVVVHNCEMDMVGAGSAEYLPTDSHVIVEIAIVEIPHVAQGGPTRVIYGGREFNLVWIIALNIEVSFCNVRDITCNRVVQKPGVEIGLVSKKARS